MQRDGCGRSSAGGVEGSDGPTGTVGGKNLGRGPNEDGRRKALIRYKLRISGQPMLLRLGGRGGETSRRGVKRKKEREKRKIRKERSGRGGGQE